MEKILVTGATGQLGGHSIDALLERTDAARIVALARDPAKALALSERGIEVRRGEYGDLQSLIAAMRGVSKLLMVSTAMFQDTVTQHRNIVAAAKAAGVSHIVYTGIQRREGSNFAIDMVTETDLATESALEDAGIPWTLMRNSLYLDSLPLIFGSKIGEKGILAPAGSEVAALGTREDFAEANAVALTTSGHEGKIYNLGGSQAGSFADMAKILGEATGAPVRYRNVSRAEFIAERTSEGVPEVAANFLAQWAEAIAAGEFSAVTKDLERLIGRRPTDYASFLTGSYASVTR